MVSMSRPNKLKYIGRDLEAMSFARNYHEWIFDTISPFLGENMVEVGAGSGSFTEILSKHRAHKLISLEPSDQMFPLLKTKVRKVSRVRCEKSFLIDAYKKNMLGNMDTMIYINVLEHIKDDAYELQIANKVLSKGGHIIIFVPAHQFLYSHFDRKIGHFRRYSKSDLESKVIESGFNIKFLRYFDMVGILPWLIRFKILKSDGMNSNIINLYDKTIVPVEKLIEKLVPPPTGKNILIVGEKK